MGRKTKADSHRIFISYSRQDAAIMRRLEKRLKAVRADLWVDHKGIRSGDNLPKRISDALEWCNILLLLWSASSKSSKWVEDEWTNAHSLGRRIIPCLLDAIPLPGILASKVYVDFRKQEEGIDELLRSLGFSEQLAAVALTGPSQRKPHVEHDRLTESPIPRKLMPAQILLRAQPITLDVADAKKMQEAKNYFDRHWNAKRIGLVHQYEAIERLGKRLVIDHTTGLTWQQSGSEKYMSFADAGKYGQDLRQQKFAAYDDWRFPTLEEAMSLMELEKKNDDLYIDPVFDKRQRWIWTADKSSAGVAWVVDFSGGYCDNYSLYNGRYVRAVR